MDDEMTKRSRVQEMAAIPPSGGFVGWDPVAGMTFAIRAVCAYLRKENIGPWAAPLSTSIGSAADAIERHFLEPRSPSE